MTWVLCAVFFLSGGAALIFETLWFHQAGLTLGNSIWATSLVLAGFMGGLAVGNGLMGRLGHRVRRPVALYALLEVLIGATGLGVVYLLPRLTPVLAVLLRPFLDAPGWLNALRLAVIFPVLLVPATAMGATLPVLLGALFRRDPRFGRVLGQLYGWNTLGAVVGAMAGELVLIERFGIRGTALVAATLNGAAALVACGLARSLDAEPAARAREREPRGLSGRALGLLTAAFICGGILLALEVVWFRLLLLFVRGTSLAFAIMLSVILGGIGLGGLAGSRWLSARPEAFRFLPALAMGSGTLGIAAYVLMDPVIQRLEGLAATQVHVIYQLGLALMFPVSCLSGMLFTLLGEALKHETAGETRSAGLFTLANTVGAMAGSLAGAFLLLPGIGVEASIRSLAAGYGLAAGAMVLGGLRPATRPQVAALCGAACLWLGAFALFPSGFMEQRVLRQRLMPLIAQGERPVALREGLTETIVYLRRDEVGEPLYHRLLTNSHSMSSTALQGQRYMKLFVYLPAALHPDVRRALVISYGVGNTAKALTDMAGVASVDVVDTSRDIVEMSDLVYPDAGGHPLRDRRVRVHIEDGRYFLQTTTGQFDLITGEPPPPKYAGIVNLYTREYFGLIRDRLAPGGMVTYWLPVHSLSERDSRAVVRAFCDVFGDCSLWGGAGWDWILLGTREVQGPVSEGHFGRLWRDRVVGPELRVLGVEMPEQLGALFLADADDLREMTRHALPLSDDYPRRLSSRYDVRAGDLAAHRSWMDVPGARARFLKSRMVRRVWPASLRERSLDYFSVQELINREIFGERLGPVTELPALHEVLTRTPLRTAALWLAGSDALLQRAVRAAVAKGRQGVELDYHLGAGALADRDYVRAAAHFRAGKEHGARQRVFDYYRIYALCLAGRLGEAGALAAQLGVLRGDDEADRRFYGFVSQTFGLGDPGRSAAGAAPTSGLMRRGVMVQHGVGTGAVVGEGGPE